MEDYSNDPVLKKFPCPLFKAQESEQKRLAALNQKVEQEKLAKKLIKSSLSGQALNKKIVFDIPIKKEEPVSTSKKLFDEEEDNEDFGGDQSNEFDAPFKRFKNSNESKIIGLQSRFAHDPRFKIDERFIDDEDNNRDFSHEQDEAKREEEKQLDILEEVLGKPLKRKYHQSEESKHNSIIIPRYDPTKAESQKFKIRKVHKLEPYQLPKENTEEEHSKPEISKERFYEISETFKKDFNDDQYDGQTFSLTKLFGRPVVDTTVETKFIPKTEFASDSGKKSKHQKKSTESDEEEDDDDDDDDEEGEDESDLDQSSRESEKKKAVKDDMSKSISAPDKSKKKDKFRENSKVSNPLLKYERFFFTEDDKRFQNNTFYSVEKIKSHIQSWKEKKIVMTTALTKKRRHFKHVSKLKTTLETGNPTDKNLKKKYRILKKTTKKH